jgi:hypothetical protein
MLSTQLKAEKSIIKMEKYDEKELYKILNKHFAGIFNTKIDRTVIIPRHHFAKSFEIIINKEKNNVFDCAEQIIERLGSNFDATPLRDGKIPVGMEVLSGGIKTPTYLNLPIEELKNYDATLLYKNLITVSAKISPNEWFSFEKVKLSMEKHDEVKNNTMRIYEGMESGKVYRIWTNDYIEKTITVRRLKPTLDMDETFAAVNIGQISDLINPNVLSTLNI